MKGVLKMLCNAVSFGYWRRGLIDIRFTEEEGAAIERRLLVVDLRAIIIYPWRIVEDKTQWEKGKAEFRETAAALYRLRGRKARQLRQARRVSSSDA